MALAPCPSCRRHVRVDEHACPFCEAEIASLSEQRGSSARMSRAALLLFASLGVAVAGCPKTRESESIVQPYGAPPRPEPELPDAASPAPSASSSQ